MTAPATDTAAESLVRGYLQLYSAEASHTLEGLAPEEVWKLIEREPASQVARLLGHLNPDVAVRVMSLMDEAALRAVVPAMEPVAAASLTTRMGEDARKNLLRVLPTRSAKELRQIMKYPPDSAGSLMDPRFTVFRPTETVEDALSRIRSHPGRRILDLFLIDDEGGLAGAIPLKDAAVASPADLLGGLAASQPTSVQATAPRNEVVELLETRKLASLPVVDYHGKLLGVIRHDALVAAAQHDASADIQSMVGASPDERALSSVSFAVRKRLPWLNINLATAFLAAAVVGLFESTIARFPVLAILLPVVAGQSGNTGAQALAVTLRGLALREIRVRDWHLVLYKESRVGLLNGIAIAIVTFIGVYVWSGSFGLSTVIGLSMILSLVAACAAGAVIPVLLTSLGQDPAQSSSIFLTTVTDVAGFMSFLGLATLMANMLPTG